MVPPHPRTTKGATVTHELICYHAVRSIACVRRPKVSKFDSKVRGLLCLLIIPQFNHYRQIDRRSQTHKIHFCYYLLVFDIGIAQKQTHHRPHRPHRRVRHWIATTTPFVFSFEIERERERENKIKYILM